NDILFEVLLQMNDVAGQHDEAGMPKTDQQRLVAGSMPWRGNQGDAPIAKYIGITVDKLKVLRRAQKLTSQRHQFIYVIVRPVPRMYPPVLSSLHQNRRVGE